MTLREAKIIVPEFDNDKKSLSEVHQGVVKQLEGAFGGVTITRGNGSWFDSKDGQIYSEPVMIFHSACDPESGSSFYTLRKVASYVKQAGKQKAVYVAFPDASVEII